MIDIDVTPDKTSYSGLLGRTRTGRFGGLWSCESLCFSRNTSLNSDIFKMNTKILTSCLFFLGIVLLSAASVNADIIEYGDFEGDNVNFLMVTEISNEVGPLYGAPTVQGDSLNFLLPPGFISQSEDGGVDFLDGRLTFMVEANEGFAINSISVTEFGAFFGIGEGSISLVNAIAFVEVDGQIFDGSFLFDSVADSDVDPTTGPWIDGLEIFFPAAKKITFFLDNQLFTRAVEGGVAFIDKKDIVISVGTIPQNGVIPEPSSMLVLCGIAGLVTMRRRR